MSSIRDIHNPWRDIMRPAFFRGATFHVDVSNRAGGRRAVVHTYPKRNDPYTEDMGRAPRAFQITGYCIGPYYLVQRDALIMALEDDGPGTLQVPWPVAGQNIEVVAGPYTMSESREKGGFCTFEMEFTEAGKPGFAGIAPLASAAMLGAASELQASISAQMNGLVGAVVTAAQSSALWDKALGGLE